MQQLYSDYQLKNTIKKQTNQNKKYHYSIVNKQQGKLSFLKNQRLLVFQYEQGKLFYSNRTKGLPFRGVHPKPKNQFALINQLLIKHVQNTNQIEFTFIYNNQNFIWKFYFQTNQIAKQWIKLLQYRKNSQKTKQKQNTTLTKNIIQVAKQNNHHQHILKQNQIDLPLQQSRIIKQLFKNFSNNQNRSNKSQKNTNYRDGDNLDWNKRFYFQRNIKTLYQFQKNIIYNFLNMLTKDDPQQKGIRLYKNNNFQIKVANRFSSHAKQLKNQYRNYHFILQATNKQFIVGIPLTSLIQFDYYVALFKARFPQNLQIISFNNVKKMHMRLHDLERYTRIKNKALQTYQVLNLTQHYDPKNTSIHYLNNLTQYLPINTEYPYEKTVVRPQYLLDQVKTFILTAPLQNLVPSQIRQLRQLGRIILQKSKQFGPKLGQKQFNITNITEIKDILHAQGFNLKQLYYIYQTITNQHIKKYVYTSLVTKVIKDYVFDNIITIRINQFKKNSQQLFNQIFVYLIQGQNNKSNQLWKQIALSFKRKYNLILTHQEIYPGFFLNSLMSLMPAKYDIKKINKRKRIFQDSNIISNGFVVQMYPKIKTYNRFLQKQLQQLKIQAHQSTKNKQISKKIYNVLVDNVSKNKIQYFEFGNNDKWMIQYLTMFIPPFQMANQDQLPLKWLYQDINIEPPTRFTLKITQNYLIWCNKKYRSEQFKRQFQKALEIAQYWLDQFHPFKSNLIEQLSQYHLILGSNQQAIKYIKQSIHLSNKFWGPQSQQFGLKYYNLADKLLNSGYKKQAKQYFITAIQKFQSKKIKSSKIGQAYLKLGSILLSDTQYEKAIEAGMFAIKSFDQFQKYHQIFAFDLQKYKIKSYQILARTYQICDKRNEYKQLIIDCARRFNLSKIVQVYQHMIRLCFGYIIFKSNFQKVQLFKKTAIIIHNQKQQFNYGREPTAIQNMMRSSQQYTIMQKFIHKFQLFDYYGFIQSQGRKIFSGESKEFIINMSNIIKIIDIDYIVGVCQQKLIQKR